MANPTLTLISSQTLGGTTASVTFSSIPTSYNDLKLVVSARGDTTTAAILMNVKLNGDTGTNYSYTNIEGNSSTVTSTRFSSSTQGISVISGGISTASTFGSAELYFPNYNSTGTKPFIAFSATENNSISANNSFLDAFAQQYRGASGITSITLTPNSGNFVANSNFYLYGIKNS